MTGKSPCRECWCSSLHDLVKWNPESRASIDAEKSRTVPVYLWGSILMVGESGDEPIVAAIPPPPVAKSLQSLLCVWRI
jgi:hypothetical protein